MPGEPWETSDTAKSMWCGAVFHGLGPLTPVKGELNATAYSNSYDNSVLPTLHQQFVYNPFLFQHDSVPVHKARFIKKWVSHFGMEEFGME